MARREVGASLRPEKPDTRRGRREVGGERAAGDMERRDNWLPRHCLSYSSISLFRQCARKWQHRKVWKTKRDPDATWDPIRLAIGKCFHKILEDSDHLPEFDRNWHKGEGRKYRIGYQISEFDLAKIVAMCIRYRELHEKSGLMVIANEVMVHDNMIGGFIDSIMVDSDYLRYWIVDNKTAAGKRKGLEESISRNVQLNMYAAFRGKVVEQIPALKGVKFGGILYRCTTKPQIRFCAEKDANFWDTVARCTTETFQIKVPAHKLIPEIVMDEAREIGQRMKLYETDQHKLLPRNLESCLAYGDNCEFWSHCYGTTATQCRHSAIVETAETFEDDGDL